MSGRSSIGGGDVVVLLFRHKGGQRAGIGSQTKSCAGRRPRGHTTTGNAVLGLSSETTEHAVWHLSGREAEAPPNRSERSRWRTHGRPALACQDGKTQGGGSRLLTGQARCPNNDLLQRKILLVTLLNPFREWNMGRGSLLAPTVAAYFGPYITANGYYLHPVRTLVSIRNTMSEMQTPIRLPINGLHDCV